MSDAGLIAEKVICSPALPRCGFSSFAKILSPFFVRR